ncbi:hypothetical protein HNP55_002426 [Paucibacter oligotrophus]|uniref:EF-hand domain-containing protein n=1 Tax=Roseateles oligotrophus TaxID=1769250 RepID=A0A840LB14_9BURK|nr:hypothetical protein [Roseateles oligotrophus]MBB4843903.1 hypothetical protein [Roseateles oligotrophus]
MISSVTSSSVPDPGLAALRPTAEDLSKKRDASAAPASAPVGSGDSDSAVVQLSSEAVRLSGQASDKPAAATSVKKYADADANQDGRVSVLEARAYDFAHPTIPKPERDGDQPPARSAMADVKAYEAVARAGRSV